MICPKCGSFMPPSAKACSKCQGLQMSKNADSKFSNTDSLSKLANTMAAIKKKQDVEDRQREVAAQIKEELRRKREEQARREEALRLEKEKLEKEEKEVIKTKSIPFDPVTAGRAAELKRLQEQKTKKYNNNSATAHASKSTNTAPKLEEDYIDIPREFQEWKGNYARTAGAFLNLFSEMMRDVNDNDCFFGDCLIGIDIGRDIAKEDWYADNFFDKLSNMFGSNKDSAQADYLAVVKAFESNKYNFMLYLANRYNVHPLEVRDKLNRSTTGTGIGAMFKHYYSNDTTMLTKIKNMLSKRYNVNDRDSEIFRGFAKDYKQRKGISGSKGIW